MNINDLNLTKQFEQLGIHQINTITPVSGGCINHGYCVITDVGKFFLKLNTHHSDTMFKAESIALKHLKLTNTIKVPEPLDYGVLSTGEAYLILEWLDLVPANQQAQKRLGQQLAQLHLIEHQQFGFEIENTIGSTPQINDWNDDWVTFFQKHRLGYQLDLIKEKYQDTDLLRKAELLSQGLPSFFEGIDFKPSLIHGDLWSGNFAMLEDGTPVMFDPASYFGHAEAELSIMNMFGGFTSHCFDAYHEIIPKSPGFERRQKLYQLYHYLNHYNLFGSGYRGQCLTLINDLLS